MAIVWSVADAISVVFGQRAATAEYREAERKRLTQLRVDATLREGNACGAAYRDIAEIPAPKDEVRPKIARSWENPRRQLK